MNRYLATTLGVLFVGIACSSNSDERAPAVNDGGASSTSGAGGRPSVGKGGNGGSEAGSAGEVDAAGTGGAAGEGGSSGEAGAGGVGGQWEEGTVIPVEPSACSEKAAWSKATPLAGISSAADERLLAITADELDILFLRDDLPMRAHRDLSSAEFGAPATLTIADGYGVDTGAALSADGTTMVLVATSGQSFAAFTRSARRADFEPNADTSAFTGINQRALQTMQHYAAPVLAPDGKTFVFSAFTPEPEGGFPTGYEGLSMVYQSAWSPNGWSMPDSISQDLFDGTTVARPLPTGLSSDSRTLFYVEEGSGEQKARFRDRPDAPLYTVVDLEQRTRATPDSKCDRLYYSREGDILVASE